MSDFKKEYSQWDEYLSVWPLARLTTMTLDDYTQAGSKESFTYWIESRLDELGSIWGGSSFKFGVFSRKDTDDKTSDAKLSYTDTHGWYSSLGASAEDAVILPFCKGRRSRHVMQPWPAAAWLSSRVRGTTRATLYEFAVFLTVFQKMH